MIEKQRQAGLPNTYIVQDQGDRERERIEVQDQMFTTGMGGVLSEQGPIQLNNVLDIGCGTGRWIIETAKTFPLISELTGVDANRSLIEYARKQAEAESVGDRVKFEVMDATMMLRFPKNFFDLVNIRAGSSFLRTWDWPRMIAEMLRVTGNYGILRVTDATIGPENNSSALTAFLALFTNALFKSGHIWEDSPSSVTDRLPGLLHQHGCTDVKTQTHRIDCSAGTEAGERYYQDVAAFAHTIKPFLNKWIGSAGKDIDELAQRALEEMSQPTFQATLVLVTAWGKKG